MSNSLLACLCFAWAKGATTPTLLDKLPFAVTSGKGLRFDIEVRRLGSQYLADLRLVNDSNEDVRVTALNSGNFTIDCLVTDQKGDRRLFSVGH